MPLYNPSSNSATIARNIATTGNAVTNSLASTAVNILVNANSNRRGLSIFNSLAGTLFIDTSNTLTATNYMVAIPSGGYFELPASDSIYTGALHGILSSGSGSVLVREFV